MLVENLDLNSSLLSVLQNYCLLIHGKSLQETIIEEFLTIMQLRIGRLTLKTEYLRFPIIKRYQIVSSFTSSCQSSQVERYFDLFLTFWLHYSLSFSTTCLQPFILTNEIDFELSLNWWIIDDFDPLLYWMIFIERLNNSSKKWKNFNWRLNWFGLNIDC